MTDQNPSPYSHPPQGSPIQPYGPTPHPSPYAPTHPMLPPYVLPPYRPSQHMLLPYVLPPYMPGVPPYLGGVRPYPPGVPPYMPGVPPYLHPSASNPWAQMQGWRQPPQSPYLHSDSAQHFEGPDLEAATDPTLSGGLGWSMWRFNGQHWDLVLDRSADQSKPVAPDLASGKFVGQTVRTPSIRFERDDAELRADVLNDQAQMNEIVARAMEIPGYGTEEEIRWIAGTAASLAPGSVWVELGALCGRTFLAAGLALPKDSTLITVDRTLGQSMRRGHTLFETYHELTQSRWDLSIVLTRADSPHAANLFREHQCNVVFIDADHQAAAVQKDIASWVPNLAPGGLICGHDYGTTPYPGLTQVVDSLPGSTVAVGSIWVWYPHAGG